MKPQVLEFFHVNLAVHQKSSLVKTDAYDAFFPKLHIPKYTSK